MLKKINHNEIHFIQRAQAERCVLKVLDGDCETAVGVSYKNTKKENYN